MKTVKKSRHIWLKIGISILILIVVGIVSLVLIGDNLRTNRPSSSEISSEAPSSSELVESSSEVPSSSEIAESSSEIVESSSEIVESSSEEAPSSSEITSSSEVKTYTIQWVNYNDEVLEVDKGVIENTIPTYDGATPLREKDAQFIYTFDTWTPKVTPATEDKIYKATYSKSTVGYDIIWKNYDGEVLEYDKDVPYGTTPTYDGELPKKESNAQAHYVFDCWTPEIKPVTKQETYTATFKAKTRGYTVTWLDYNDAILEKDLDVLYGTMPTFDKGDPQRPKDEQYTYKFSGWTPEVKAVTGDVSYKATYSTSVNGYQITWVDYNDSVLELDKDVPYNSMPSYDGEEPTRISKNGIAYKFNGWSPAVGPVKCDKTYKATYKEENLKFTVTWVDAYGNILEIDSNVPYGATPKYDGELPKKEKNEMYTYVFKGWYPEIEPVTKDITYSPEFEYITNKYVVKWVNDDGTIIEQEEYAYGDIPEYKGETPVKESLINMDFVFTGWTPEIVEVTQDATYTATYKNIMTAFTVTWVNYNYDELEIDENVPKGTMPEYNGPTPVRPYNDKYFYRFFGWLPWLSPVTESVIYKANYLECRNSLTVSWCNDENVVIEEDVDCHYMDMPEYNGPTPTKRSTEKYDYIFVGWSPEIKPITDDTTYYAVFKEVIKTHKVTWLNYDDTVLKVDEKVDHGSTPTYDGPTPVRIGVDSLEYIFSHWDPQISPVTQDVTYKAVFKTNETDGFYYGKYPRNLIDFPTDVAALNELVGELPTDNDLKGWNKISAYNKGCLNSETVCYKDIAYNGDVVRAVKDLSGYYHGVDFSTGVYYFEFNRVYWSRLTPKGIDPVYSCNEVLENHCFNTSLEDKVIDGIAHEPCEYHTSDLNIWLNSTFANILLKDETNKNIIAETPFNKDDEIILKDNASNVKYKTATHKEKLFILGYHDLLNRYYGYTEKRFRREYASDYARYLGICCYKESWVYYCCYMTQMSKTGYGKTIGYYVNREGEFTRTQLNNRFYAGILPCFSVAI